MISKLFLSIHDYHQAVVVGRILFRLQLTAEGAILVGKSIFNQFYTVRFQRGNKLATPFLLLI